MRGNPWHLGKAGSRRRAPEGLLLAAALGHLVGCAAETLNPSLPIDRETASAALEAMAGAPRPLARPVVVLGGFLDPGLGCVRLAGRLRRAVCGEDPAAEAGRRIFAVSFFFNCTVDGCRSRLIAAVDAAFPSADPIFTAEVDVVALSMGGLLARDAAAPPRADAASRRRLRIRRLFTISTPHRGARLAALPELLPFVQDLRRGSHYLRRLDREWSQRDYELFAYVSLGDFIVGAGNAAPPGTLAWWVAKRPWLPAHWAVPSEPRIIADIARRLRDETPFATAPPAPLPGTE